MNTEREFSSHFEFVCWKLEETPKSDNQVNVAFVRLEGKAMIPIFLDPTERISSGEEATRMAENLRLSIEEYLDFRSCNQDAPSARQLIQSRL
jgi:hypothetical protein